MLLADQVSKKSFLGDREGTAPYLNLKYGAQNGFMPRLGGVENGRTFSEWVSSAPHMSNQIIAIPLTPPGFLDIIASPDVARGLKKIWADVFSVHCKTITGLNSTLSVETAEIQMGPSNALFLEDDTKTVRERSSLSYGFDERLRKVIGKFLEFLIINTAGHEHTQTPPISSNKEFREHMKRDVWSPDKKSGTILYVELDVVNVNVIDAWLGGNIRNKKAYTREGKKDITSGREQLTYDIDMMSFIEVGDYIDEYAQHIVDRMNIFYKNPETDMKGWVSKDEANDMLTNPEGAGFNQDAGLSSSVQM